MKHNQSFHSIKMALVLFVFLGMPGCETYTPKTGTIVGPRNLTIEGTVSDVTLGKSSISGDYGDVINFVVTIEEGNQRQRIAVEARSLKIVGQVVENSHVRVTGGFNKNRIFIATKIKDVETGATINLISHPNPIINWLVSEP